MMVVVAVEGEKDEAAGRVLGELGTRSVQGVSPRVTY